ARLPSAGNEYAPSAYRPSVPASHRIIAWVTPFTFIRQASMAAVSSELQTKLLSKVLARYEDSTLTSYGAGPLRFTQWCDQHHISESLRMPADRILLGAFVADMHEGGTGARVRSWMAGLQLWHRINGAEWEGDDFLVQAVLKTADKEGKVFSRPLRNPIDLTHLRALRASLTLTLPRDAAIWAAATIAFWGCRRLGELLPCANRKFDPEHHPTRATDTSRGVVDGLVTVSFHLPFTKTTGVQGARCRITSTPGCYADVCPVWALDNHLAINSSLPASSHLFAFASRGRDFPLTKEILLPLMDSIVSAAGLDPVKGHSYRIGGTLRLLLDGVSPEYIMQIGGWTSLCFLTYWRRLDLVIPAEL
ncbi:hypothetical protein HDZ31DRAFT_8212, partial [Schizophyllum fasciatum]